jgi:chromate transport protein ChrA
MEIKGWQKLSIDQNLNMCKDYLLGIKYSTFTIIVFSTYGFVKTLLNPQPLNLKWLLILIAALICCFTHYRILKLIRTIQTILFAYETYQKKEDETQKK